MRKEVKKYTGDKQNINSYTLTEKVNKSTFFYE
jgi:hypothetical protein